MTLPTRAERDAIRAHYAAYDRQPEPESSAWATILNLLDALDQLELELANARAINRLGADDLDAAGDVLGPR